MDINTRIEFVKQVIKNESWNKKDRSFNNWIKKSWKNHLTDLIKERDSE